MLRRPGTGLNGSEPSIGAQLTSRIEIASRRFRASDRRPVTSMIPTRRHSSVRPSNEIPPSGTSGRRDGLRLEWAEGSAPSATGALSSCLPKPNGTYSSSAEPLLSRIVSTTPASARVVVSPRARFSAMSRRRRRMILPERVLGRSGVNRRNFGRAIGPIT